MRTRSSPNTFGHPIMRRGMPLLLYHGTSRSFDRFDPTFWDDEEGFFFTPCLGYARRYARGPEGRVLSVHLDMANPYRCTQDEWGIALGLGPDEARLAGHDGYVVAPYSLGTMFIVWNVEAIHVVSHDIDATVLPLAA